MTNTKNYILEYFISTTKFSKKEDLEDYVKQSLRKFSSDIIDIEVKSHENNYLILRIKSTAKIIDACHEKLNIERDWAFRSKDELGDYLRKKAYPVLSNIETSLRNFVYQSMIDVFDFNWWDLFIPESIREKVKKTESKTSKSSVKLQHQIEFTLFDDLIEIVTEEFQAWPDSHVVTAAELVELFSNSATFQEVHKKITGKRKVMSFWDDVFSNYFEDKEAWSQLKGKIIKYVIPIRNKVMHHRLIRQYELRELNKCHQEIIHLISLAKPQLSNPDLEKSKQSAVAILKNVANTQTSYSSALMSAMQIAANNIQPPDTSALIKAMQNAIDNYPPPNTSAIMKAMQIAANNIQPPDTSALIKAMQNAIDNYSPPDTSVLMKAMQNAIDNYSPPNISAIAKAMQNFQTNNDENNSNNDSYDNGNDNGDDDGNDDDDDNETTLINK